MPMRPVHLLLLVGAAAAAAEHRTEQVSVVLALSHHPESVSAIEERLYRAADPHSPTYGAWLSSDELTAVLSASNDQVDRAVAWAEAQCGDQGTVKVERAEVEGQGDFLRLHLRLYTAEPEACLAAVLAAAPQQRGLLDGAFLPGAANSMSEPKARKQVPAPRNPRTFPFHAETSSGGVQLGTPAAQREAYGIPAALGNENPSNLQLVWGPGTFGFLPSDLEVPVVLLKGHGAVTKAPLSARSRFSSSTFFAPPHLDRPPTTNAPHSFTPWSTTPMPSLLTMLSSVPPLPGVLCNLQRVRGPFPDLHVRLPGHGRR